VVAVVEDLTATGEYDAPGGDSDWAAGDDVPE
jgi:hypothetical protein